MVSEQESGYICGFSIYTGKSSNELVSADATLDKDCSITTKTVMGLLQVQDYSTITELYSSTTTSGKFYNSGIYVF